MSKLREHRFIFYYIIIFFLALFILNLGVLFSYYLDIILLGNCPEFLLREFTKNFFLWELAFVVSIGYVFYRFIYIYIKQKRETQQIFRIILQAISHKFGNFLAIQKINIQLLNNNPDSEIIRRLKNSICLIESDLYQIISILKNFESQDLKPNSIEISKIVKKLLQKNIYNNKNFKLYLRLHSVRIKSISLITETVISLLIENAFKYANQKISIRIGTYQGETYVYISNDIKSVISPGSGLGLKIAHLLCEKSGAKLISKSGKGLYQVLVVWPSPRSLLDPQWREFKRVLFHNFFTKN